MKQNCTLVLAGRRAVILSSISFCFSEPSSSLLNSSKHSPYAFSISVCFFLCVDFSCLVFLLLVNCLNLSYSNRQMLLCVDFCAAYSKMQPCS